MAFYYCRPVVVIEGFIAHVTPFQTTGLEQGFSASGSTVRVMLTPIPCSNIRRNRDETTLACEEQQKTRLAHRTGKSGKKLSNETGF